MLPLYHFIMTPRVPLKINGLEISRQQPIPFMNKITQEKKFEALPWSRPLASSSESRVYTEPRLNSTYSPGKKYLHQCEKYQRRLRGQTRLAKVLEEKHANLNKCLKLIDKLMAENQTLRGCIPDRQKAKENTYKYNTDRLDVNKFQVDSYRSPSRQQENLKNELQTVKFQRDKLFELVKKLEREQKLLKTKEEPDISYIGGVSSPKHKKQSSQPMKTSSTLHSDTKSQRREPQQIELVKIRQFTSQNQLLEVIKMLREEKEHSGQKIHRLQQIYKKSLKNYQDLLDRYQAEIANSSALREERDRLQLLLKQPHSQTQRQANSTVVGLNTIESARQQQIAELNVELKQSQRKHDKIEGELHEATKDKQKLEQQNRELRKNMSVLQERHQQSISQYQKQIEGLRQNSLDTERSHQELKEAIGTKLKLIQQLKETIQRVQQENRPINPIHDNHPSPKQSQRSRQTADKWVQKSCQDFLNQQDLIAQIIEKDILISQLELQNTKLQSMIAELKGEPKKGCESTLDLARSKSQNSSLRDQIVEKDIRIHQLQQIIRCSKISLEDTKEPSQDR